MCFKSDHDAVALCFTKRPCREMELLQCNDFGREGEGSEQLRIVSLSPLDTNQGGSPSCSWFRGCCGQGVMCSPGHTVATEYRLFWLSILAVGAVDLGMVQGVHRDKRAWGFWLHPGSCQSKPTTVCGNDPGVQSVPNIHGINSGPCSPAPPLMSS